jgi:hypothetical protein
MIYHRSYVTAKIRVCTRINGKAHAKKMWEEEDGRRPRWKEVCSNGIEWDDVS